ncbi:MAG: type VI secretion system baseplate subunit TssF [Pseudomonadota bacterium]
MPHRFERGQGAHWRLISHLSLNYLSLDEAGLEAFREMLTLHDLSGSASARRQVSGIVAIRQSPAMAWLPGDVQPALVRGLEIRLVIDERAFAASGIHGFAHVIEQFFSLYLSTSNFTRLIMVSARSGEELLRCSPRAGILNLV